MQVTGHVCLVLVVDLHPNLSTYMPCTGTFLSYTRTGTWYICTSISLHVHVLPCHSFSCCVLLVHSRLLLVFQIIDFGGFKKCFFNWGLKKIEVSQDCQGNQGKCTRVSRATSQVGMYETC